MTKWIVIGLASVCVYTFVMRLLWGPLEELLRRYKLGNSYSYEDNARGWACFWPFYLPGVVVAVPVLLVTVGPYKLAEHIVKRTRPRDNAPAEVPDPAPSLPYDPGQSAQIAEIARALKLPVKTGPCTCDSCEEAGVRGSNG